MALTGPLGAHGQTALLAQRVGQEDINRKAVVLLGRPVNVNGGRARQWAEFAIVAGAARDREASMISAT